MRCRRGHLRVKIAWVKKYVLFGVLLSCALGETWAQKETQKPSIKKNNCAIYVDEYFKSQNRLLVTADDFYECFETTFNNGSTVLLAKETLFRQFEFYYEDQCTSDYTEPYPCNRFKRYSMSVANEGPADIRSICEITLPENKVRVLSKKNNVDLSDCLKLGMQEINMEAFNTLKTKVLKIGYNGDSYEMKITILAYDYMQE